MHSISPTARISPLADLEDSVRGSCLVIGNERVVDSFVKIKFTGGTGDVIVGARSHLNSGTVVYSGNGVRIGNDVLVAANCTFAPVNHAYTRRDIPISQQRFLPSKGGIVIGDGVWIGANCVVLDGAVLGEGCIVAAHSLVRGTLEPYSINVGTPATLQRYRPE